MFMSLKLIDKLEDIRRIASLMRMMFKIRPHKEFEFSIRRQEKSANMTAICAYFKLFRSRDRIRTSKQKL